MSRSIAFERQGDVLRSVDSTSCGFMPLRDGTADDPRRFAPLTEGAVLQLHQEQQAESARLTTVLDTRSCTAWTGVTMRGDESFEWLDLWLGCALPGALSRMSVDEEVRSSGRVRPSFGWGSMATVDGGNVAYLTLAPDPGGSRHEIGVIGHGPEAGRLTDQVAESIRTWNDHYRDREVEFAVAPRGTRLSGQFVFDRPVDQLAVTWLA